MVYTLLACELSKEALAHDTVALQYVYSRRRSKRTIRAPSCGTH